MIFPVNLGKVLRLAVNICKTSNFSGEKLFPPHSAGSGENTFSPHSAGSGEKFSLPFNRRKTIHR